MHCGNCGAENPSGADRCSRCGEPLLGASDPKRAEAGSKRAVPAPPVEVIPDPVPIGRIAVRAIAFAAAIAVVCALAYLFVVPRPIAIDASSFPDDVFRDAVAKQADADGDGMLSRNELRAVESLDVAGLGVADLNGIERFENLAALDVSDCTELAALSLAGLPHLALLDARGAGISELDVSGCTKLAALQCDDSVDVIGLDATMLQQRWLLERFSLDGVNGIGEPRANASSGHREMAFEYDDAGRLARKEVSDQGDSDPAPFSTITTYTYDAQGRVAALERSSSSSTANKSLVLAYDEEGRLTGYDGLDRARIAYEEGHVAAVAYGDYTPTAFEYNDEGLLSASHAQQDSLGGSATAYAYDASGRVAEMRWLVSGAVVGSLAYTYDAAGHLVSRSFEFEGIGAYEDIFAYDAQGRLVQASRGDSTYILNYDARGNLVSYGDPDGRVTIGRLSYRRVFVGKDAPASPFVLCMGDPLLEVRDADPVEINLLEGQDPIVAYDGDRIAAL